jgi:hypothetical protein
MKILMLPVMLIFMILSVSGQVDPNQDYTPGSGAPKYFDLGGHLFIGDYPINNPSPTGDTGVAYLYRKSNGNLIPVDTNVFTYLGYYVFPKLPEGAYVVKTVLTKGSVNYKNFIPAYFPDALRWMDATGRILSDSNNYTSHVRLIPTKTISGGPGKIAGRVVLGEPGVFNTGAPSAQVILYGFQGEPLKFTSCDEQGWFEFEDLPYGSYYLYVEIPGKYSRYTGVWLDNMSSVAENVFVGVYEQDVTGIIETLPAVFEVGVLFPNPTSDQVHLRLMVRNSLIAHVDIVDSHSFVVEKLERKCQKGYNDLIIPVASLAPGIYMLRVWSEINNSAVVQKFVKL